jgi:hypothetical protein
MASNQIDTRSLLPCQNHQNHKSQRSKSCSFVSSWRGERQFIVDIPSVDVPLERTVRLTTVYMDAYSADLGRPRLF